MSANLDSIVNQPTEENENAFSTNLPRSGSNISEIDSRLPSDPSDPRNSGYQLPQPGQSYPTSSPHESRTFIDLKAPSNIGQAPLNPVDLMTPMFLKTHSNPERKPSNTGYQQVSNMTAPSTTSTLFERRLSKDLNIVSQTDLDALHSKALDIVSEIRLDSDSNIVSKTKSDSNIVSKTELDSNIDSMPESKDSPDDDAPKVTNVISKEQLDTNRLGERGKFSNQEVAGSIPSIRYFGPK